MQRPGDQICIDNRPTGSTQLFKIKARLNIQTVSKLKDLIITDEAYCDEPAPVPVKQVKPWTMSGCSQSPDAIFIFRTIFFTWFSLSIHLTHSINWIILPAQLEMLFWKNGLCHF